MVSGDIYQVIYGGHMMSSTEPQPPVLPILGFAAILLIGLIFTVLTLLSFFVR